MMGGIGLLVTDGGYSLADLPALFLQTKSEEGQPEKFNPFTRQLLAKCTHSTRYFWDYQWSNWTPSDGRNGPIQPTIRYSGTFSTSGRFSPVALGTMPLWILASGRQSLLAVCQSALPVFVRNGHHPSRQYDHHQAVLRLYAASTDS